MDAFEQQRQAFRKKFGRDWGPNDPIFFDPDADEPVRISEVRMEAEVLDALRKADAPPEIAYAYKKTGLLYLGGDNSLWPKEHIEEWEAAVAEYHLIERRPWRKAARSRKGGTLRSRNCWSPTSRKRTSITSGPA